MLVLYMSACISRWGVIHRQELHLKLNLQQMCGWIQEYKPQSLYEKGNKINHFDWKRKQEANVCNSSICVSSEVSNLIRRSQVSLFLLIELFPTSINKETVDILEDPGASKHKKAWLPAGSVMEAKERAKAWQEHNIFCRKLT